VNGGLLERLAKRSNDVSLGRLKARLRENLTRHAPTLLEQARSDSRARARLKAYIADFLMREGIMLDSDRRSAMIDALHAELVGMGPLEELLADPEVQEVMVNGPSTVYVEKSGRLELTEVRFESEEALWEVLLRMVEAAGRRIDRSSPYVDARLPGGARLNAIVPPLSVKGPAITIRKFSRHFRSLEDLVRAGCVEARVADFLRSCVLQRANMLITGPASSGKTTLLNVLCALIPPGAERVITIEDAAELDLPYPHVVALEARPANVEGRGQITIRQLVINALRMRPDRLIVGECRGAEAFDMVQAMLTGHEGSMSTIHASSPYDALIRLESMVLMAGEGVPHKVIRQQIASAIDVIVHLRREADGTRKVSEVAVVLPPSPAGELALWTLFPWTEGRVPGPGEVPDWNSIKARLKEERREAEVL